MKPAEIDFAVRPMKTPIGTIRLVAVEEGLVGVRFANDASRIRDGLDNASAETHLDNAEKALSEYFAGTRKDFSHLPVLAKGTAWQLKVWGTLFKIPFGQTKSYAEIAQSVGNPKAMRAVGLANGRNPIPIIIPCHRVIGANGTLTGFGGGLPAKKWLLEHEGVAARPMI
ncbi:MAG: methylated-DNA--[protein]-cysteine S-methyltransferase [Rhizobiales bacterium]|nr:methylated-DNA--[protein]-cysteine S-methyltransferase [Hyphomicrobiales bacterium]